MRVSISVIRMFVLCILNCFLCSFSHEECLDMSELENTHVTEKNFSVIPSTRRRAKRGKQTLNSLVSDLVLKFRQLNTSMTSTKCAKDFNHFLHNLDSPWALQMLDSYGKIAPGILRGARVWTGQYSECLSVHAPLDNEGRGGFHGKYCVATWNPNKKDRLPPFRMGLCVPDSCSGSAVQKLFIKFLENRSLLDAVPFMKNQKTDITFDTVKCKIKERPLDTPSIIYLCTASIPIILVVLGSLLSLSINRKLNSEARQKPLSTMEIHDNGQLISNKFSETKNEMSKTMENDSTRNENGFISPKRESHSSHSVSTIKRILLCFSIFTNAEKILKTENSEGQLLSLHGIRCLSILWTIFGHIFLLVEPITSNFKDCLKAIDTLAYQLILQAYFAVDTFFVLSGFLLGYLFLKEVEKREKINWIHFYIIRIWRLTPPYFFVIFFDMLLFKYVGSGPFWNDDHCNAARSYWWFYIMYINNFIPFRQMCCQWTWYLAADMQFYVISPLFLVTLWKWPKRGFIIIGSFLVATWTVTGVISYSYELIPALTSMPLVEDHVVFANRLENMRNKIYYMPYCRIAPYLIGIILGYTLHKTGGRKHFLSQWQSLLGWIIALIFIFGVTFGLYHNEPGRIGAALYSAFARTLFAIGVAWIIYACETGHGGFITNFLSWKPFIPLSRLTYSTYLVHILIINFYFDNLQSPLHMSKSMMNFHLLSFIVLSYGFAFIFCCVFEAPFMNLLKLTFKRKE